MFAKSVKSKRTGRRGWRFRFTNPLTHTRSWRTEWFAERREAEKALRLFLEDLERQAVGLQSNTCWKLSWSDAVARFLAEAPIGTGKRRNDLERLLTANPCGVQALADLCNLGKLTARCNAIAAEKGDEYVRKCVQQPLKQLSAWAASVSLLPHHPLAAWKKIPRTSQPRHRRAFLPDEMLDVLAAADELDALLGRHFPTSLVFKTLLLTGNRPGAVFGAKVGDLDAASGRIILPPGNGKKRNGMAFLPEPFVQELQGFLARRGKPGADESLLLSPDGAILERRNFHRLFAKAMTLAAVRRAWVDNADASGTDPVNVAMLLFSGRCRGFDGAPPKDAEKLARRKRHMEATEAMAALVGSDVARFCERRDMYALRKTHVSWARRLVNADSVKLQVGHAPQDVEERHYLDLVDARVAAQAVWDVLTGTRALTGERVQAEPLRLAAGAENLQAVDYQTDYGEKAGENAAARRAASVTQTATATATSVSASCRTRTYDPLIKSQLLYRLS